MSPQCAGSEKATITIFNSSAQIAEKIISKKPPVDYTITEIASCWEYGGNGLKADCSPTEQVFTSFYRGLKPQFETRTVPQGQNFAGCQFSFVILEGVRLFPDFSGGGAPGTTFVRRTTTNDPTCDPSVGEGIFWKVVVTDATGQIYQHTFAYEPKVEIACDEGCPPGYLRCEHPRYPGYCCIPCKETANKINNLANKIR